MGSAPQQRNGGGGGGGGRGRPAYGMYPPDPSDSHEGSRDPRHQGSPSTWGRVGPAGQPEQHIDPEDTAAPPARHGEGYATSNSEQHWTPARGRRENGGPIAAAAGPARYLDEGDPDHQYADARQQWRGYAQDDGWDGDGRQHAYPRNPRSRPILEAYEEQQHMASSGGWPEEADPRGIPRPQYGDVDRRPIGGRLMPRHAGPRGVPSRELRSHDGYGEEDMNGAGFAGDGRRRLLRPPNSGGRPMPVRSSAWPKDTGYSSAAAAAAPSLRGDEFEKEVVRAAARLVAERELKAREEARMKAERIEGEWPDDLTRRRYENRSENRESARNGGGGVVAAAAAAVDGRQRTRSKDVDGGRGKRPSSSREREQHQYAGRRDSGGHNLKKYGRDAPGEDRGDKKRARRGDSPSSRTGGGRGEDRGSVGSAKGEDKRGVSSKDNRGREGSTGSRSQRDEDRNKHRGRGDDREKAHSSSRDEGHNRAGQDTRAGGTRDADKDIDRRADDPRIPSSRTAKPSSSTWERDGGKGNADSNADLDRWGSKRADTENAPRSREIFGTSPPQGSTASRDFEVSTADSGFYVHVGGISFSTTFTALAKRFAAFGDVTGFKVIFNNVTCRSAQSSAGGHRGQDEASKAAVVTASTGFAFIAFENEEGVEKAIECMNNQKLDGHVLKVRAGTFERVGKIKRVSRAQVYTHSRGGD